MNAITPRGIEINLEAARPLEAVRVARNMLHTTRVVSFATLDPSGFPYSTATNLAVDHDGTPIIFMAWLALHARNIEIDPRASITMADHRSDVLITPRLTLSGCLEKASREEADKLKDLYLRRFPKAKLYLALPDALLYRLRVQSVQLNGGPAQNANDVSPQNILTDLSGAAALLSGEDVFVAELNALPGTAERIAAAAGQSGKGSWTITTVDPDGINLRSAEGAARWWFPERAQTKKAVQEALSRLA